MSTYGAFKTDGRLETEGVILDLGAAGRFRLARAGGSNKRYAKRLEALTKAHRRQIQNGTMPNEVAEQLLSQVYAETILLGWEGVTDAQGDSLEFSIAAASKLLQDLPDLFTEIKETAQDSAVYRAAEIEADSGNS